MAKSGFVYCIKNDAMPGLVKIGATTRDPADRLDEARHATWAPSCFRITAQAAVDDAFETERVLHALLAPRRFEARREFFKLSDEETRAVFAVVEIIAGATSATIPTAPETREAREPCDAQISSSTRSPEAQLGQLRAWVESRYIRLPLREKDTGTKLEALYSAYTSAIQPVHQKQLGRNKFAAMLNSVYAGIGPHRNAAGTVNGLYLLR